MNQHQNTPRQTLMSTPPGTAPHRLNVYLNDRANHRLGLPQNPATGKAFLTLIAESIASNQAHLHKSAAKEALVSHEAQFGLTSFPQTGAITIQEMMLLTPRIWTSKRAADKADPRIIGAECGHLQEAFDFARLELPDRMTSPARACLEAGIEKAKTMGQDDHSKRLVEILQMLTEIEQNKELPLDLSDAVWLLTHRSGLYYKDIEAVVKMRRRGLEALINGQSKLTQRHTPMLQNLEDFFSVPRGSLTALIRARRRGLGCIKADLFPSGIEGAQTPQERARISRFLPYDFAQKPEDERIKLIQAVLENFNAGVTDYSRARHDLQRQPYSLLQNWPAGLKDETDALIAFYRDSVIDLGKQRTGGGWSSGSEDHYRGMISCLFGFFRSDFNTQFTIPPGDLALAFFIFPELVHPYVKWRAKRLEEAFEREFLTRADVDFFSFARWLMAKGHGYIRQHPELGERLIAVKTRGGKPLITAEMISTATENWDAACDRAEQTYDELVKSHIDKIEVSRDSHEALLPILNLPNPLVVFSMAMKGLQHELDGLAPDSDAYCVVIKDRALFGIMSQTGFRLETTFRLNIEHLSFKDGQWHLKVPNKFFKNGKGEWFRVKVKSNGRKRLYRSHYERPLIDKHGLYESLDLYVNSLRKKLLGSAKTSALFVASTTEKERAMWAKRSKKSVSDPARFSKRGITRAIERIFLWHAAWDPLQETGIKGFCGNVGPHAIRHILATGVLKLTHRLDLAADAIHDSIETVEKYYVRYLPEDREQDLRDALDRGM